MTMGVGGVGIENRIGLSASFDRGAAAPGNVQLGLKLDF